MTLAVWVVLVMVLVPFVALGCPIPVAVAFFGLYTIAAIYAGIIWAWIERP